MIANSTKETFYRCLGELATEFSNLEERLLLLILTLKDPLDFSKALIEIQYDGFSRRIAALERLATGKNFYPEKIKTLVLKLDLLKDERNSLIHGVWSRPSVVDNEIYMVVENYKYDLIEPNNNEVFPLIKMKEYTITQLYEKIKVVRTLGSEILDFSLQYHEDQKKKK